MSDRELDRGGVRVFFFSFFFCPPVLFRFRVCDECFLDAEIEAPGDFRTIKVALKKNLFFFPLGRMFVAG